MLKLIDIIILKIKNEIIVNSYKMTDLNYHYKIIIIIINFQNNILGYSIKLIFNKLIILKTIIKLVT